MDREADRVKDRIDVDVGEFNPVLGRSYAEVAGISRSMHRSQGMGAAERRGAARESFVVTAGEPAKRDFFDGIDLSWNRIPGGAEAGRLIARVVQEFNPSHPDRVIPHLLAARGLAGSRAGEIDEAIAQCAGLWLDAAADRSSVLPGESVQVKVTALNRSSFAFDSVKVTLAGPGGSVQRDLSTTPLAYNRPAEATIAYAIPRDQPYSQPFWLVKPKQGDTYTIEDQGLIGPPDSAPVLEARFQIAAGSARIELTRPVLYRYVDRVQGELTRPLVVVPPVAVNVTESVRLFPQAEKRSIHVLVQAEQANAEGQVKLEMPAGWTAQPADLPFKLPARGQQQELIFDITPPAGAAVTHLRAVAEIGGRAVSQGIQVISYPHIPVQTVFPPANEKLVRADIKVTAKNVGYIMGAGDEMPRALEQMGCNVTLLSAADLEQRNLSGFDAIVAGVRAFNVRADLIANQHRLLEYVRRGGTYIVQYNTVDRGVTLPQIGPYPLTFGLDMQRRPDRVTVEDAPVRFPNPGNPLLFAPNEITQRDFEGWVQERGLYFASQWDPKYQPVLESHDPRSPPNEGGMLYTRYGDGVYIFTGYAWFRQLPAGVPGAYRIFANMLSAGHTR
jgi:hypothetical protein